MAQGQAFTTEQREEIMQTLLPHLAMGFSRNKACAFIGLNPTTLSKWVQDDEALSMKLTSAENTNSVLALANIYQALQNENKLLGEGKEVRADNSWKLISKLEDKYKDKLDVTSDDKALPTPILTLTDVHTNNSDEEGSGV
jgi:hypothetical protein